MSKKLFSFLLLVCILLTNVNVYASEITNQEEDPNKTASFAFNYDLAIKNVNIVNPARNEILYKYNIAISGGKIKAKELCYFASSSIWTAPMFLER